MPDGDRVRVQLKDGRKGTVDRSQLLHVLANGGKALDEEGALKKAGRGAAIGAFEGAGVAPTQDPVKDTLEGLKGQAADMFAPWRHPLKLESYKKMLMANPAVTIPKAIGTKGEELLEDVGIIGRVQPGQKEPTSQPFDIEKTSQDLTALVTQLLMLKGGKKAAETPVGEGTLAKGGRSMIREAADRGPKAVNKAAEAAAKETAEKTGKFKEEASQKLAEAKGKHEAEIAEREKTIAERKAQHTKDVEEAKGKHGAAVEAAEKKLSTGAAKEASARLQNERLRQAKAKLTGYRDRLVKSTTEMVQKAHDTERGQLDTRWNDFNGKVKSLKGDLSKIGQDVLDAEKQDIKGSSENIKVFRDVLGRLKENMVEQEDGSMKFLDKQMRTLDHFRDYWRELGDVLYRKEGLPADVKAAVERVRNGLEREFEASIRDNYGNAVGDEMMTQYGKLKEDWSGYKRTWHDRSRVNPLPRVLDLLQEQATTKGGVDVSGKIADALNVKHAGAAARTLLEAKKSFGARPDIIRGLNAVTAKLKGFEKMTATVPETKLPKFPGEFKEPEAPKEPPEITEAKIPSLGQPPDVEPFDRQQFIREGVEKKIKQTGNLGSGFGVLWAIHDLIKGDPTAAGRVAEAIALMQGMKSVMTRPKVLDWLSKDVQ